jgi:DNA-binding LytR/AlgR family response regulator
MNILIVEDEPLAAAQLAMHIAALRPEAKIVQVCDTIKSTVAWVQNNTTPDLAFFDIHLGDGLSFDIFEQVKLALPVIFVTAFDQYAIQAFKVNSVDYLLKPIDRADLSRALNKFDLLSNPKISGITPEILHQIAASLKKKSYKERFLVKVGTHLRVAETHDILYFYSLQKGTYLKLADGKDYVLDLTLEMVEDLVDPERFFRINRKYLVSLKSINDVITYSNSRLKLKVLHPVDDEFLVAREKVKEFKEWLEGKI